MPSIYYLVLALAFSSTYFFAYWYFNIRRVEFIDNFEVSKPTKTKIEQPIKKEKDCPYCGEKIKSQAIYCRFCNHDLN